MTYLELEAASATAYREQNRSLFTLGTPSWGALGRVARAADMNPRELFAVIHKAAIVAIAAQGPIDWSGAYGSLRCAGAIDGPALIATIITAVLGVVCPALGAAAPLIEPILSAVIGAILAALKSQFASGQFGSSPAAYSAQLQRWAAETCVA